MTRKTLFSIAWQLPLLCVLSFPLATAANQAETTLGAVGSTGTGSSPTATPVDRFERYNRAMYRFNTGIDRTVLRPLAEGYAKLPRPIRGGIGVARTGVPPSNASIIIN